MGIFSAFISSSSSSHPPPAPANTPPASSEKEPPLAPPPTSGSAGRKVSPLNKKKSSAGGPLGSSSSKSTPAPAVVASGGKLKGNGSEGGGNKVNGGTTTEQPPPYTGDHHQHQPKLVPTTANGGDVGRDSRDSSASGEFVVEGAVVQHTVTTTTFFPLFRRKHHHPPPLPPPQLEPPLLSTAAAIALPPSPAIPSSSSFPSSSPPAPPSKPLPSSSSRAASQPHPTSRSTAVLHPLPHSPDLPLVPPTSSSSRHVSASAAMGGGSKRRLSSEEKGKGKGLPQLPGMEAKSLPKTPTRSRSPSPEAGGSKDEAGSRDLGMAGEKEGRAHEERADEGAEGESSSSTIEGGADTLQVVTSELKAFVHRGPARGASIVVTPSSPLLGATLEGPPDPDPGPFLPSMSSSSSSSSSTTVPPSSNSSSPLPSTIHEDFTTPPTYPSPLPIPNERTAQQTLARRTSQMSLGHGFPSFTASPPPSSPPELPSNLPPPPPSPIFEHEARTSSTFLGSTTSASSSLPPQRHDLPTSPPMLVPPTFTTSTSTSILSTFSPSSVSYLPVSFGSSSSSSSNVNSKKPKLGRAKSHATLNDTTPRPSVVHSLSDSTQPPPSELPASTSVQTKPATKRMSSMDIFASFTSSNSSSSSSSTAAAAGLDWRQRVKRRASASALGGAEREREKERARSKSGGGQPARFVVPPLPNANASTSSLEPPPSLPSSTRSTPSGGKRLSLWARRGSTFDRIPPPATSTTSNTFSSTSEATSTTNNSSSAVSPVLSDVEDPDAALRSMQFTLPLFDLGKRFSFGEMGGRGVAGAEERQEVLVDSPTAEEVMGLGLGLGVEEEEDEKIKGGKESGRLRVDTTAGAGGGEAEGESTTAKGGGGFPIDSTPSSPHPLFGQPSPTHSLSSGRALVPLFEHHPTSAATSSTSSFPHEPYSTVSSSRSSTSIHNVGSIIPPSYGLPPPSPSSSIRSATLRRPSLSPMRSNSSGSTSVGGRIRESMFGISRPTAGRARSSSTLLGGSRSSNKPSDGLFGLMDNLRPPTVGSPSSSSSLDPFGSISSTHSLSPNSPVTSSSLSRSGSQHRHVVDEFGSAGFLSTDPSANATRSSFSSSPSRSNSIFRRPRSATSPPPADLLFPGNHSPSKSSSRSSRPMSIRRLSSALFDIGGSSNSNSLTASPSSSPNQTLRRDTSASLFPLPSRASSSSSILLSPSGRKSPSKRRESIASSVGSGMGGAEKERSNRPIADVPTREEEESPETWLRRLLEAVPKYEVANVLAVSGDEFHVAALRAYMSSFDFSGKPLDVALRRLLMEVALPRETQQIDRVMESFAKQYLEGNPGLFTNEDHPYILAFSLIMLHTDAFNKSNKNKMSKADYIKNTRLDGVLPEVLDTFFDNITFTPFVFVEDDDAVLGSQRTLPAESSLDPSSTTLFSTSQGGPSSGSSLLLGSKSTKVDVYYLISENLTQTLRADVQSHIPSEDPFSYHGGPGRTSFDTGEIHASFVAADIIEIGPPGGSGSSGGGGGGIGARKPSTGSLLLNATAAVVESKVQTLRLTKFGVLSRKEDLGDGGRKASNRKWRDWTVILTGSQLLFFKDPAWATVLQKQAEEQSSIAGSRRGSEASGRILLNKMSSFKPDEVLSVKDSIAITETSYNKYPNAFRFVMPHGRQYLLQAADEVELTEWMSRINYASAFKTASIRMRGMGMDSSQAQLAGAAAAASHARALRSEDVGSSRASSIKASSSAATGDFSTPSSSTTQLNVNPFAEAFGPAGPSSTKTNGNSTPSTSPRTTSSAPRSPLFTAPRLRSLSRPPPVDLESPIFSPEEDGEQLETAFMEIKAELAAGRGGATRLSTSTASEEHANRARAASVDASFSARSSFEKHHFLSRAGTNAVGVAGSPHASRSEALKFKVDSLQSKISATEMHLNAELRVARNLAVLTPFQRSTRDRIQLAVIPLAKKVRHLRMELARLRCYEEILRTDLQVETDAWKSMKSIAHQAAQNSLSGGSSQPKPSAIGTLPSLEISLHTGTTPPRREPIGIPRGAGHRSTSLRRSSIASFRSANENLSSSRSPSDDEDDDDSTNPRPSSQNNLDAPSSSWPKPLGTPSPPTTLSRPSSPSPTPSLVEQQHHDEDLERPTDWKSTRAAKRVSLANVPESTVRRISLRLRKESLDDMRSRHRLLQVTPADGAAAEEGGEVGEIPVAVEESRSRSFRRRASVGRRAKSEDDRDSTREETKGLGFP